jgi:hypothetical protein
MKILKFYETYGEAATQKAFGADPEVIRQWGRRLREEDEFPAKKAHFIFQKDFAGSAM